MKITNIRNRKSNDITEISIDRGLITNPQNSEDKTTFRARDDIVAWPGLVNGHIHSGNVIGYLKDFESRYDHSVYDWLGRLFKEPFYDSKHALYKLNLFEKYNYTSEDSASVLSNFMFSQGITSGLLFNYKPEEHGKFKIGDSTSELPRLRIQDGGISVSTFRDLINSPNLDEKIEEIKQRKGIFQIHISEAVEDYLSGEKLSGEIGKLIEFGLVDERTVLIHGLNMTSDEMKKLQEFGDNGPSVVVCQTSNQNLYPSLKFPPWIERDTYDHVNPIFLNNLGINTGLGTDSFLSNSGCNLLHEAYFCETLGTPHNYANRKHDLFEMITSKNAKAMNLANRIGSLEVGKNGDVVLFSSDSIEDCQKPYAVFSNGRLVVGEDCAEIREFYSKNSIDVETHKGLVFPRASGYLDALEKIRLIADEYNHNIRNTNHHQLIIPNNLSLD
jgi:cytosine/adenosine deaminase-related metal-dependent hydrolase